MQRAAESASGAFGQRFACCLRLRPAIHFAQLMHGHAHVGSRNSFRRRLCVRTALRDPNPTCTTGSPSEHGDPLVADGRATHLPRCGDERKVRGASLVGCLAVAAVISSLR